MKITQKPLKYFNKKRGVFDIPSFNEAYNKANGIPSRDKWDFLTKVRADNFGICSGRVTMKMIKDIK